MQETHGYKKIANSYLLSLPWFNCVFTKKLLFIAAIYKKYILKHICNCILVFVCSWVKIF